jgi:uncharacterized RDD family membrane protein YckC
MSVPPPLPPANPYAAPVARVEDLPTGELELADRSVRLAAAIVDGLFLFGPIMLGAVLAGAMTAGRSAELWFPVATLLGLAVFLGVLITNCVLLHRNGQTIAKRLFAIKIVRVDGSPVSLVHVIFARWLPVALLGMIPYLGVLFSLGDPLLIFRSDHRCLHDLIAGTTVVKA